MKSSYGYDPRSYGRNFSNCLEKPEKVRTSTEFEPVTSRYRCDALRNFSNCVEKPEKFKSMTARIIALLDYFLLRKKRKERYSKSINFKLKQDIQTHTQDIAML